VKFGFREIPDPGQTTVVRPRPIVDVVVEGLEIAPQACLLDSGATAVRFGMHVAVGGSVKCLHRRRCRNWCDAQYPALSTANTGRAIWG